MADDAIRRQTADLFAILRSAHDSEHGPTNRAGYCAHSDGISAGFCQTGIYIAHVDAIKAEAVRQERARILAALREQCRYELGDGVVVIGYPGVLRAVEGRA